jgi:hypothetical protein
MTLDWLGTTTTTMTDDGLVGKVGDPIWPLDTRSQHHTIRPTWDALMFGRTPMISTDAAHGTTVAVPASNGLPGKDIVQAGTTTKKLFDSI